MKRSAIISCDGLYRYLLRREWDASRAPLGFVMLNPSTADAAADDPTIRRCIGFAAREGAGGLVVANLFAFRATKPELYAQPAERRIGPDLFDYMREGLLECSAVVCAWGADAGRDRVSPIHLQRVFNVIRGAVGLQMFCLGVACNGWPRHPLYVRKGTPLSLYVHWRGLGASVLAPQVTHPGEVTQ